MAQWPPPKYAPAPTVYAVAQPGGRRATTSLSQVT